MGGAEVFTREVATRWVRCGHEVTLFTSEFRSCKHEEVLDDIRVVRAGGRFSVYWRAKKFYRNRFAKERFDVVVDEINTRPFFAPRFVSRGEKVVALIHQLAREYWFYDMPFPISYIGYYFLEDRWLRQYVNVPTVTVSESTRRDLLDLGFRRVFVVSEGLGLWPLAEVPVKAERPLVVFVGRLRRAKRPDHAIRAFRIVREKVPDAELWVLGDGGFRRDLEGMAGDGVRFLDSLSDEQRREWVGRSWVLINPSVREGWGLNVVEANAFGVPCVAYDVAGLRDSVKNGETGLLAEAGNIEDLAEKIVMVLNDGALRKELSQNALNCSRRFSWDETAKTFMTVLTACLQ